MPARAVGTRAVLIAIVSCALWCSAASGEVVPGHPDESIQQAYPIQAHTTYTGAFDSTSYDDVDYLALTVPQAGETLRFTVQNVTGACNDPNDAGCPVYATLMDRSDKQVGGNASAAGTVATVGDTEAFDWSFAQAGTYYLLLESNGDLPAGRPSYAVSYQQVSGSLGSVPLIRSLKVARHQHGRAVRATLVLGQPATRLGVAVLLRRSHGPAKRVESMTLRHLSVGRHRLVIRLPRSIAAKHPYRLRLWLRLKAVASSGDHTSLVRRVTLAG